ncbi:tetratricopeptide repeat protein [Maribacter litopenaei]|uniref:Tetratricopeptide repeat protein n=1 Tax=Maribacter litopenaei TaxID=2976127 RepID=A0ABY5YBN4_9FLAO|nr:tetratricopeptide repeat protein [Maribacter litopenaei]UWX56456.1 tetratricopeptide repeat protein [Maribacter litopenaei]
MKYISQVLIVFTLTILGVGCSTTKEVAITFKEPSPVTLTNEIKTIGIIDATEQSLVKLEGQSNLDAVAASDEQWLSVNGTEASIEGLLDALSKDRRFQGVKLIDRSDIAKSLGSVQLDQATWNKIGELCKENKVDAIFALAHFDVDTRLTVRKATITETDLMRTQQRVKGQEITMETLIENGWRIFDPNKKEIIDEIVTNDQLITSSQGKDLTEAFNNLGGRRQSALDFSKNTGVAYGQRLLPYEQQVLREYFVKGDKGLNEAHVLIQEGQIAEAKNRLKPLVMDENTDLGSKASYNLAVLNEYQGDVEAAVEWTLKSIELKRRPLNEEYLKILKSRQTKNILLQQQYPEIGSLD